LVRSSENSIATGLSINEIQRLLGPDPSEAFAVRT
jgi:hypothetical protein